MGRHAATTSQARTRTIQRERALRTGASVVSQSRSQARSHRTAAVRPGSSAASSSSSSFVRPAGIVASTALVLGGALGGFLTINGTAQPAQAVEAPEVGTGTAPEAPLVEGAQVTVDGTAVPLNAQAPSLADALREAGVVVGTHDEVSAALAGAVPTEPVAIARVAVQTVADQEVTAHGSSEVADANLPKGERRVQVKGVDGVTTVVSSVTMKDGAEAGRQEIARVTVTPKVDEVVAVGTKEPTAAPAAAPAPAAPAAQGGQSGNSSAPAPAAPAGNYSPGSSKAIAAEMVAARGWGQEQMTCLTNLWERESNWNHTAQNPTSSAYGIPQALPGSKMASAGADWRTNPRTQITWGLGYIADRYGTPCAAWAHSEAKNWY